MAKKVVLAGACRTAIGTMGGTLSTTPAPELGAIVIKEALKRAGVAPEAVDQVYMGCVIQAGQGQNVARQAAIKAGLPIEVPAVTMNVVCGSGLNCVNQAAQMIMAGDHQTTNRCQIYCIQCSVQLIQYLRIQSVQCFLTVDGNGCHIAILLIQNVIHVFTSFHISIRVFKTTLRR